MLHRGHVILGDGVENIADEKIRRRMAVGQEGGAQRAGRFSGHGDLLKWLAHHPCEVIVVSFTQNLLSWFHLHKGVFRGFGFTSFIIVVSDSHRPMKLLFRLNRRQSC